MTLTAALLATSVGCLNPEFVNSPFLNLLTRVEPDRAEPEPASPHETEESPYRVVFSCSHTRPPGLPCLLRSERI